MFAVSAYDNSTLWVTLRTGPAIEEPHFYVTSSLIGTTHSQTGPYAQWSASSPHDINQGHFFGKHINILPNELAQAIVLHLPNKDK